MDFQHSLMRWIFPFVFVLHLGCGSTSENEDQETQGVSDELAQTTTESEKVDGAQELRQDEEFEADDDEEATADGENMNLDEELAKDETTEQSPQQSKSEPPKPGDLQTLLGEPNSPSFETASSVPRASIKEIKYLSQINGGTIAIELSKEATYKIRQGNNDKQYVLEISNTVLPDRFKRPFITKEFEGPFISFEAYQAASSSTTRILIQQKISGEPSVRMSGTVLYLSSPERPLQDEQMTLVSKVQAVEESAVALPQQIKETEGVVDEGMVLKSKSLYEYLTSNNRFYGKKISLEVRGADIRDVLNFIAETSGLNMIVDDQVNGKITMKLNKIPWDQALLLILQTRRLGYLRQGNVLRIAPLSTLKEEAEEANLILESRKKLEDLVIKIVLVSYASAKEIVPQITGFLSRRGSAVADARTSAVIVTDVASNIEKIEKVIKSLDTPPPQVLIEGKVVEAQEDFSQELGLAWSFVGQSSKLGTNGKNGSPITLVPTVSVTPGLPKSTTFTAGINIANANFFGDVSAALSLYELDRKIKVLSSPRIATLHNVESEITQNTQVPYLQPQTTTTQGVIVPPTYAFKDVKLSLKVTPQVTSDESIILDLSIDRDVLGDTNTNAPPTINQRHAKTKVLVKNGQTAVIGGIYQNDTTSSSGGVPLLKDIPILGWLFKSNTDRQIRNELLIFLTPRILSGPITSTIN